MQYPLDLYSLLAELQRLWARNMASKGSSGLSKLRSRAESNATDIVRLDNADTVTTKQQENRFLQKSTDPLGFCVCLTKLPLE